MSTFWLNRAIAGLLGAAGTMDMAGVLVVGPALVVGLPIARIGDGGSIGRGEDDLLDLGSGSEVVFSTGDVGLSPDGTGRDCMEARCSEAADPDKDPERDLALV